MIKIIAIPDCNRRSFQYIWVRHVTDQWVAYYECGMSLMIATSFDLVTLATWLNSRNYSYRINKSI